MASPQSAPVARWLRVIPCRWTRALHGIPFPGGGRRRDADGPPSSVPRPPASRCPAPQVPLHGGYVAGDSTNAVAGRSRARCFPQPQRPPWRHHLEHSLLANPAGSRGCAPSLRTCAPRGGVLSGPASGHTADAAGHTGLGPSSCSHRPRLGTVRFGPRWNLFHCQGVVSGLETCTPLSIPSSVARTARCVGLIDATQGGASRFPARIPGRRH